jgi:glycogen synthase
MRFGLVSREVYPFIGGGLSRYVTATAESLASVGEVTIFTTTKHQRRFRELEKAGSPDLPVGVRFVFIPEPTEPDRGAFYHHLHAWSARVYDVLRAEYGAHGPELIEFPDYLGEACVPIQAKRSLDRTLRNTCVCIRLYTTSEMTRILNGSIASTFDNRVLFDLERLALRRADRIIWPGGDVYETFRRFYAPDQLAPGWQIPHAVRSASITSSDASPSDGSLRLLYLGRLERRKGVQDLIRAVTSIPRDDWSLTLVGDDTDTAPLGTSMRTQLELMSADDPRITFRDSVSSADVPALFHQHDLCVVPSLWECWPNVALEALGQNRPVLASPVGGLVGMIESNRSGWFSREVGERPLRDAIEGLINERERVRAASRAGTPRGRFEELTDPDVVRRGYLALVEEHESIRRSRAKRRRRPLVSVVITYFELDAYVEETLRAVFNQTHRDLEVIVVNDGSLRAADALLEELAGSYPFRVITQQNSGLGSARNMGITQSRGRYVLPFDADDLLAPTFIERCVDVHLENPGLAYVTSWSNFIDEEGRELADEFGGYRPLGNGAKALDAVNIAGSAEAVFDRRMFDLGYAYSHELSSYEDWLHFRQLQAEGFEGFIIPEQLLSYRVRTGSMVRTVAVRQHDRLLDEMESHLRAREVQWTPVNG